jgi:hypothetical protein
MANRLHITSCHISNGFYSLTKALTHRRSTKGGREGTTKAQEGKMHFFRFEAFVTVSGSVFVVLQTVSCLL